MSDLNSLLRAIITNPNEDIPRLMYADALDELPTQTVKCPKCKGTGLGSKFHFAGVPCYHDCSQCGGTKIVTDISHSNRAEFIRLQCEIAKYPVRKKLAYFGREPNVVKDEGHDHYSLTYDPEGITPGDRVDVLVFRGRGRPNKWMYGVRVIKIIGEHKIVVRKDAESVQCPSDKLREREKELMGEDGRNLFPDWRGWVLKTIPDLQRQAGAVRRGFIESIVLTAEDFLKHADTLVWNEKQKVTCLGCHGHGTYYYEARSWPPHKENYDETCPTCDNEKEIPRPCPDTAHPIRKVTLTTTGGIETWWVEDAPNRLHTVYAEIRGRRFSKAFDDRYYREMGTYRCSLQVIEYGYSQEFPGIEFKVQE